MNTTQKLLAIGGLAAIVTGGAAYAVSASGGGDDQEAPITGADLERASAAALAHTGEGAVSDTEIGDEESYYEIEVTLDDGSEVDVQLDESFQVVDAMADDGDDAAGDDD